MTKLACLTYHIVFDAISVGVGLVATVKAVLNLVYSQNTKLLESPGSQVGDKLTVGRELSLATLSSNLGVESLVLEHLSGTNDGNTRRVASLEDSDEVKLSAGREQLIRLNGLVLLLGVVAVSCSRRAEDGCKKLPVAENVADSARNREECARDLEVILHALSDGRRSLEDEDIVVLGGGDSVV